MCFSVEKDPNPGNSNCYRTRSDKRVALANNRLVRYYVRYYVSHTMLYTMLDSMLDTMLDTMFPILC